ncbi:MAG TPA: ABC transporter substrate-binding protein [Burkholderiaceae bacterium]|nr:ABC transporter substrate-binding protein [Burkholderiaceae bacterium]HYB50887.1 ABC transporter substrate-binding protein [Burkholderiaceae bacterium]
MKGLAITVGIAAGLALGPGAAARAETGVTDTEIKVGMVNVQEGPAAALGKAMRAGAEAVFNAVNAKGGVNGRKITLLVADDSYEPDKSVDETLKMIEQQQVFALFGSVGTPTTNAVVPILKEMDVPLVGPFTGSMALRQPVTRQIFNIRASYNDEAEALVAQFLAHGAKSIGVFYQDDGFGLAVLSGTEKAMQKRGLSVAAKSTFPRNTLAVKSGLATMLEAKPDAIIMVGPYAPIAAFIKEARAANLKSQLATVSFVGTDSLVAQVGKDGDGVIISQVVPFPEDADSAVTRSCKELLGQSGTELGFVNLEGCISAKVFVYGLEHAGRALTRTNLIGALEGMQSVDLGGVTVTLSGASHQALNQVFLTQVRDGHIAKLQ